ncbi:MAG: hypothetical protein ACXAC2_00735 [Candidatus Kariarchaeaceae archaeon]|jgi:hypothetical protein
MQDTVEHHNANSIFNIKKNRSGIKWLGIPRIFWYNINGKDHYTKYVDLDPAKGKRKDKILFIIAHWTQLYDAWHWWKMWKIAMYNLTDVFSGLTVFFLTLFLVGSDYLFLVFVYLFIYFWTIGFWWIWSFNIHYDKWLIRKEDR